MQICNKFFKSEFKREFKMESKSSVFLAIIVLFAVVMFPSEIFAETQNITTVTPINEKISMQKTVATMIVPEDNAFSWGFVKGEASDYAERYPVIIQFYKGEEPVHVAQVDVKGDGSYEYKFRVRSVDNITGEIKNIFEGQYTVKIFKVIHNQIEII